jgi:hypothetical protein
MTEPIPAADTYERQRVAVLDTELSYIRHRRGRSGRLLARQPHLLLPLAQRRSAC